MSLIIEHYPIAPIFQFLSCTSQFKVDIHEAYERGILNETETNETALKVLRSIKFKSDILSFFTKPVVLLPIAGLIFVGLSFIPFSPVVFLAIRILLGAIAGGLIGYCIQNYNLLSQLSQAYKDQSNKAFEHIKELEANDQLVPLLR